MFISPCLNLTTIAAYLFRTVVHAFRSRLNIRLIGLGERVLILGGPVADPLLRTTPICCAYLVAG
jgi:hypothetical protein